MPLVFRRQKISHQGIREPDYPFLVGSSEAKSFEPLNKQDGGRRKMIEIESFSQVCSVSVFNLLDKTSGVHFNNLKDWLPDLNKSVNAVI